MQKETKTKIIKKMQLFYIAFVHTNKTMKRRFANTYNILTLFFFLFFCSAICNLLIANTRRNY